MKIKNFFKRSSDLYIAISAENIERRDAEPFYSFDTDMPKVQPLWDVKESGFEIYERTIGEKYEAEPTIEFKLGEPKVLLLPMGESVKLLTAGKQPLLLAAPMMPEAITVENLEAQHIIYFSETEFKDGIETIVEDKITREGSRNFIGAKITGALLLMVGLASILFPSISLKAAKVNYTVDPTNTTPGLSLSIASNDLAVTDNQGSLAIQTQTNQLVTSTLGLDVSTTGADGYKMYVTTSGTDKLGGYTNALVNKDIAGADGKGVKIQSLDNSVQTINFPAGYWGYTTTAVTGIQNSTIFNPFPIYDADDGVKRGGVEIASTNTAVADTDAAGETPFTIGIKADETLPAGDYANELLFTVIANPVMITYNLMFDGNVTDSSLAGVPATVTGHTADVFTDIAVPNAEPTRDEYVFLGWADSPSATEPDYIYGDSAKDKVTLQVTDINNSQTVDKTVYAVWKEKDWIQDFDADNELLNVGDSKILWDKRDGETYTVKRLPDDNVWMTQNLKLNGARTLTSADSDVASNFSMPANSSSWCSGTECYNTAQVYYDATRESYGSLYSWNAITAGTGTSDTTSGNAVSSICPKGWRLPTSNEYSALDIALGGDGSVRSNVPADLATYENVAGFDYPGGINSTLTAVGEYGRWWSSTAGNNSSAYYMYLDARDNHDVVHPDMLNYKYFGGSARCIARSSTNDNTKYMQDFNDAIDLRTVGDVDNYTDKRDNKTYSVARLADGKVWMTQNIAYETGATKMRDDYGGYYLRANANNICPVGWHLPTTAEFSALDRAYGGAGTGKNANAPSFSKLAGDPAKWTLSGFYRTTNTQYGNIGWDQVGENGYYMASDVNTVHAGNIMTANIIPDTRTVWMDANTTANTYATNIRCVGDQPNVFYIQDFDSKTMLPHLGDSATLTDRRDNKTYTVKRLKDGKVWMTKNLAYATGSSYNHASYGSYYTWANALNVCPAEWHLPTGGPGGELETLYNQYGTVASFMDANGPNFYKAGRIVSGAVTNANTDGYYWSQTTNTDTEAWYLDVTDTKIYVELDYPKTYPLSVRCVADVDAKVSFDANGGTGTMATQNFAKGVRQNISANTFTRTGYRFSGWALTADATTARYADEEPVAFNKSTTLYAVWKPNYMQDFDAKTELLNAGDTATLMDNRDEATYTVKRLADGKVWMTQNMAYATGATIAPNARGGYYSWSAAQNVCPTGWHLPASSEYAKMYDNYSSVTAFTTDGPELGFDGRWMTSSNNYQYVDSAGYYWNSTNTDEAFSFNNNGQVWLTYTYLSTSYSNQVRCIADEGETISFDANGGTGTMADVTVERGESVTLTNSFTREGYDFLGWSESASATTATYTNGQVIVPTSDTTLYAVWKKQTILFQAKNSCATITAGSTGTLADSRDNQEYSVYRWSNDSAPEDMGGYCMMSRDLSLGYVTSGGVTKGGDLTLTAEDSAVAGTISARTGTGNWSTTNADSNLQYINGAGGENDSQSYYSYGAAQSVCPKGWRLPTREEYNNIRAYVGGDSSAGSAAFRSDPYNFGKTGFFYQSGWNNTGVSGRYWTSSEYTAASGYHMYLTTTNVNTSTYNKSYGLAVRCISTEQKTVSFNANGGTGTMASQTVEKGRSLTLSTNTMTRANYVFMGWSENASATTGTYIDGETITVNSNMTLYAIWRPQGSFFQANNSCDTITPGSTGTLADSRDNQIYNVYRWTDDSAPDGMGEYCMMTQDLGLGYVTGGSVTKGANLALTADDSVAAGTILAKSSNSTWVSTNADTNLQYTNGTGGANNSHSYYSYGAAQSICPKGWRLPTQAEYDKIATFMGGNNSTGSSTIRNAPYNFTYGGVFYNGGWNYLNASGYYWSSTQSNSTNGYYLYLDASGLRTNTNVKNVGRAVRCIAGQEKATVTFNSNGGTGTMANARVVKGGSLALPTNTFTWTDHNFLGWSESSTATTPTYTDRETITVNNDITLYAVWEWTVTQSTVKINNYTYTAAIQNEAATWSTARTTCANLAPAGSWSLPTKAQFQNMISTAEGKALAYNTWGAGRLWSSSSAPAGEGGARYYHLNITSATQATFNDAYTYGTYRVVCVLN